MRMPLLLLSFALLGFAPAPVFRERPDDPESLLRKLQGGWRGVTYRHAGQDQLTGTPFRVHLEKDRWRFLVGSPPNETNVYTITLDTKANPMRIEWRTNETSLLGLFALTGDRLRYSFRTAKEYPRSLTTPDPDDWVIEVEREK